MDRHHSGTTVRAAKKMMAASDANDPKTAPHQSGTNCGPPTWGCGSCRDRDALNADELKSLVRYTLGFEAQLDRLANALAHLVERTRRGMTPRNLRD
jgi:hypothetical protein